MLSGIQPDSLTKYGPLAQLVEQKTLNLRVSGSSPGRPTEDRDTRQIEGVLLGYGAKGELTRVVTFEWRDDIEVFDELEPWWNKQVGPKNSPFLRTEWFRLWAQCRIGSGKRLCVLVAREGAAPVAAVPLLKRGARLVALSDTDTDSFDMVCVDDVRIHTAVARKLLRCTYVRVDRLDGASRLIDNVNRSLGWRVRRALDAPYIVTADGMEPVLAEMGKKLRSNVRRGERHLRSMGELSMEPSTPKEQVETTLKESMQLEASGWKGGIGRAVANSDEQARFYRQLAEVATVRDWLRLGVLRLDGRIIAFNFDLEYQGRLFGLTTSYDERLDARCSPGHVLLLKTLEHCVQRGVQTYELGGGNDNQWKLRWTSLTRRRYDVIGFGENLSGRVGWATSALRSMLRPDSSSRSDPNQQAVLTPEVMDR